MSANDTLRFASAIRAVRGRIYKITGDTIS